MCTQLVLSLIINQILMNINYRELLSNRCSRQAITVSKFFPSMISPAEHNCKKKGFVELLLRKEIPRSETTVLKGMTAKCYHMAVKKINSLNGDKGLHTDCLWKETATLACCFDELASNCNGSTKC